MLANYWKYGRWEKRYWYVPPVTLLGWFVAFSIVYMIPAEIAAVSSHDAPLSAFDNEM